MNQSRFWLVVVSILLAVSLIGSQTNFASATSYPRSCYPYYSWNYSYYGYYDYYGYYPYNWYPYYYCGYSYAGYFPFYYYGYYYSPYYTPTSKHQLTINTDPVNLANVTGPGSYSEGNTASFGVSQTVIQKSPDTRYIFSHWSGDYSGVGSSGTLTMDTSKSITAVFQLQYRLRLDSQPSSVPVPDGDGWYNAGDSVVLSVSSTILGGDSGSRLIFGGWSLDGQNIASGNSLTVKMDAPHIATVNYQQQYYLKVMSDQGIPFGEGWYDAGSSAQIYVSTPVSSSYGVSILFNGWQGDFQSSAQSAKVMMDGPKTVVATWRIDSSIRDFTVAVGVIAAIAVVGAAVLLTLKRRTSPGPSARIVQHNSTLGQVSLVTKTTSSQ